MSLQNEQELTNTIGKLRHLEERYSALQKDTSEDPRVRELTMHSLKKLINQMKEEVARFKAHQPAG